MIHVVQYACALGCADLETVRPHHEALCTRNGWVYWAKSEPDRLTFVPECYFAKIAWVYEVLLRVSNGDIVLYLDTDSVMVHPNPPIAEALDARDLGFVREKTRDFNAGVILIEANPVTREFFKAVLDHGPALDYSASGHKLGDQCTINKLIHAFPVSVKQLTARWNRYPHALGFEYDPAPDFIRSAHGCEGLAKTAFIETQVKHFARSCPPLPL